MARRSVGNRRVEGGSSSAVARTAVHGGGMGELFEESGIGGVGGNSLIGVLIESIGEARVPFQGAVAGNYRTDNDLDVELVGTAMERAMEASWQLVLEEDDLYTLEEGGGVKRQLAQTVVQGLGGKCQACRVNPIGVDDVQCMNGSSCNSPGKVFAMCATCRGQARITPAGDVIARITPKPLGKPFHVTANPPLVVSTRSEDDRDKARAVDREKWKGWTHLERRLHERVAPDADHQSIQRFIEDVAGMLRDAIPAMVLVGDRDSILLRIGDYGGVHLSPQPGGYLQWGTWFPPTSDWYGRASREEWVKGVAPLIEGRVARLLAG